MTGKWIYIFIKRNLAFTRRVKAICFKGYEVNTAGSIRYFVPSTNIIFTFWCPEGYFLRDEDDSYYPRS